MNIRDDSVSKVSFPDFLRREGAIFLSKPPQTKTIPGFMPKRLLYQKGTKI